MEISCETKGRILEKPELVLSLLNSAGICRPGWSKERMSRALSQSQVVVTAWIGDELVGFARVISDFAWCGYLSQIAVDPNHQRKGIGRQLIQIVKSELGPEVSLLVHSADTATEFYTSLGFNEYSNVLRLPRLN